MASVALKGSNLQTVTDSTGRFQLIIPNNRGILVFSFFGYLSQEVVITGKSNYKITLEPDLTEEDEEVVYEKPSDFVRVGLTSGINYTHFGLQADFQLRRFSPKQPFFVSYRKQFHDANSLTYYSIGRANMFPFMVLPITTVMAYSRRNINLGEELEWIEASAKTHSVDTQLGQIGVCIGLQNEQIEGQKRISFSFVAQWQKTFFEFLTTSIQVKKWQEATQVVYEVDYYWAKPKLSLIMNGIHHNGYQELTLGLAYNFKL